MAIIELKADKGGRLHISVKDKLGQLHKVNQLDRLDSLVIDDGGASTSLSSEGIKIRANSVSSFSIGNYHVTDEYSVRTENGYVSINGYEIFYIPTELGRGGFWLNGTFMAFTVVEHTVFTPSILYPPVDQTVSIPRFSEIISSKYENNDSYTDISYEWQISDTADFSNIVFTETLSSYGHFKLPDNVLTNGTVYYTRVRFVGTINTI